MSVRILHGDCRERIRELPDGTVHCIVTSPPYFGLRDYGVAGQIGLEDTPDAFVLELVELGRQIPQHTRQDLIRRLDAVIGGQTPHPVLTSH